MKSQSRNPQPRPQGAFPWFGGIIMAFHLQSQGKARPCGRGWEILYSLVLVSLTV